MNVLIYSGSSNHSSKLSNQLLYPFLRSILSRSYDLKLANAQLLNQQPWQHSTSLVIIPDLDHPELEAVFDHTRRSIRQWVARGGRYLGIGSGARFAGIDQLNLIDLHWKLLPSLDPSHSSHSDRLLSFVHQPHLSHQPLDPSKPLYVADGPVNEDRTTTVWARYHDQVVGLLSRHQSGSIALMGFDIGHHPERLVEILTQIGLSGLDASSSVTDEHPSTLYLVSSLPSEIVRSNHQLILRGCSGQPPALEDTQNKFSLQADHQPPSPTIRSKDLLPMVLCPDTSLPDSVPLTFDWKRYFSIINDQSSTLGSTILYAETMASTQTLLEKNNKLADSLPSGTVSITTRQTHGRGRGSNNWISTEGSIQFSLLLKLSNLGSSVVFVQYLFGLAVVEWIERFFKSQLLVRLKWPNDIYGSCRHGSSGTSLTDFKKLGGILVNCSFGGLSGTECKLVVGFGLNNRSAPQPTATCLSELIQAAVVSRSHDGDDQTDLTKSNDEPRYHHPSVEEIIAGILGSFDEMWTRFQAQGFQPFHSLYLSRWLHSNQIIRLDKTGESLRILGIEPSYGLLRTTTSIHDDHDHSSSSSHPPNHFVDLQPDANSFDMFSGLIKTKV